MKLIIGKALNYKAMTSGASIQIAYNALTVDMLKEAVSEMKHEIESGGGYPAVWVDSIVWHYNIATKQVVYGPCLMANCRCQIEDGPPQVPDMSKINWKAYGV